MPRVAMWRLQWDLKCNHPDGWHRTYHLAMTPHYDHVQWCKVVISHGQFKATLGLSYLHQSHLSSIQYVYTLYLRDSLSFTGHVTHSTHLKAK